MVEVQGKLIAIDDPIRAKRLGFGPSIHELVRFRSLGCWPVTAASRSTASDLPSVVQETLLARTSERNGRVSDEGSLEEQKREGYF